MTGGGATVLMTRTAHTAHLRGLTAQHGSSGTLGIAIAIGVCVLLVAVTITVVARGFSNGSGNDDDHEEGGPGGRGPRRPPDPGPSEPDPPWWQEFERDFAWHVADSRTSQPAACGPVGVLPEILPRVRAEPATLALRTCVAGRIRAGAPSGGGPRAVRPAGFEPATFRSGGGRSIH
jgi:hypothetical protein